MHFFTLYLYTLTFGGQGRNFGLKMGVPIQEGERGTHGY